MTKKRRLTMGLSTSLFALAVGCGGSAAAPDCVSKPDFTCSPSGFPFVVVAIAVSDFCLSLGSDCGDVIPPVGATTVSSSEPGAGELCVAGTVEGGGFASLLLSFARKKDAGTVILEPFDAAGRGIAAVTLAIDTPPSQGIAFGAHMIKQSTCPANAGDCFYPPNFVFANVSTPGPVMAPLAEFRSEEDPTLAIDPTVLDDVYFTVGTGDYDFCVHDFKLLDAAGAEVKP